MAGTRRQWTPLNFLIFSPHRCSVREYSREAVTPEEVEYILDCASTAPSAGNLEAWDVVLVADEGEREVLSHAAYDQPHIENAAVFLLYVQIMSVQCRDTVKGEYYMQCRTRR